MVREEADEDPPRAHGRRGDAPHPRAGYRQDGEHHGRRAPLGTPTFDEDHVAGLGRPDLPVLLLDASAQQALAEWLARRDVLAPAPPPPLAVRARRWLTGLARRLGRAPGTFVVGRAVPAADSPVAH